MKTNSLRDMTPVELDQQVIQLKEELFNLRFQHATGQLDNPMRLREVRKSIARTKTVLREKELGLVRK
ncbi:MAG: 50S ribosomal protein L29 [Peptococcaceae bacterium]|nr:50S ribosomal protein L29 [Peptococcaceae bacterium]